MMVVHRKGILRVFKFTGKQWISETWLNKGDSTGTCLKLRASQPATFGRSDAFDLYSEAPCFE